MAKILIVEDDADLRRMFKSALNFGGYDVLEAGDGLHALRQMETNEFDGIVLDLGLPVVSGHVVLQEVAALAHTQNVPVVVVVTGLPGPHELPSASCVLTKPVTPERLVGTVRRCLAAGAAGSGV